MTVEVLAQLQMYYLGEKSLGKAPAELDVYEMAWSLQKTPDEIRGMDAFDFQMMRAVPLARKLADEERMNRKAGQ